MGTFAEFKAKFGYLAVGDEKFLHELYQQYQYLFEKMKVAYDDISVDCKSDYECWVDESGEINEDDIHWFSKKPDRECVINGDDCLNLQIAFGTAKSFDEFLEMI